MSAILNPDLHPTKNTNQQRKGKTMRLNKKQMENVMELTTGARKAVKDTQELELTFLVERVGITNDQARLVVDAYDAIEGIMAATRCARWGAWNLFMAGVRTKTVPVNRILTRA